MSSQKPKFAVLGQLPDDLAQEISSAVDIQPSTSAVEDIHGLLIHGPTATPDFATLKPYLDAGRILTFYQPTDEHLSQMLKLVGFAPSSGIPMMSCFKNLKTQLYTVVKGAAVRQNSKPNISEGMVVQQPSLAGHLNGTLTILNNPPPLVAALVPYSPTFTTAIWGALRVVETDPSTAPISMPSPSPENCEQDAGDTTCDAANSPSNPKIDDKNWYAGAQSGSVYFYADYYVYWTSGDNGSGQPYFYVVRYDNGSFSAGNPISVTKDTTGYLSGLWQIFPVEITPLHSSTPTLPSFQSPSGYVDGSNPISVWAPNVPIDFFVNNPQGGGFASMTWTPGSNQQGEILPVATMNLSGWYVMQSNQNSLVMSQKEGWDFNTFQPWKGGQNWTNFYHDLYGQDSWNNGNVVIAATFPQLSAGQIPFSNVWGWQFYAPAQSGDGQTSAYKPQNSYPISITLQQMGDSAISVTWGYYTFFLHGQSACYSTSPGPHVWWSEFFNAIEAASTLDLGAIVNHKVTLSN